MTTNEPKQPSTRLLGRSDWAGWSRSGELLFAKNGCLFRIKIHKPATLGEPEQLIDMSSLKFSAVEAPKFALLVLRALQG